MQVGSEIGEDRIGRLLGKGGMSEVYEAEHTRLGSRHAIKFFTYDKDVAGVRERFLTEGKLLAKLSHPHVARVTDASKDAETGRPYFVMDLIVAPDGVVRSLADVPAGSEDEEQIAMWYDDLRDGLAYIHSKGVVHRDLKLENILIGPDGHVVLTDFGISKIGVAEDGDRVVDPVQTIVRLRDGKNPLMGSLGYMAPELEMGVPASPQSDYYALGVIVFRLLTGLWCDSRTDVVGALESFDPVWQRILPKLLHSNPRGRECPSWRDLQSANAEKQLLDMENAIAAARAETFAQRRRARWILCTASFACIAFLIGVVLLLNFAWHVSEPTFEDVVFISEDAPEEESDTHASRDQLSAAIVDAWALGHGVFLDLRKGKINREKAASVLEHLAERAANDDLNLFNDYPMYAPSGENQALAELLHAAAERVRGWSR